MEPPQTSPYDSAYSSHSSASRSTSASSSSSLPHDLSDSFSSLSIKFSFARKLGYTEEQVRLAMTKLGENVGENELLGELIKLDDGVKKEEEIGEESEVKLRPIVVDGSNVAFR